MQQEKNYEQPNGQDMPDTLRDYSVKQLSRLNRSLNKPILVLHSHVECYTVFFTVKSINRQFMMSSLVARINIKDSSKPSSRSESIY